MSERKILITKYNPVTGMSLNFVAQPAVSLQTKKDGRQTKRKQSTPSVHFKQNVHTTTHVYATKNHKITVSINNNNIKQYNNVVNKTNNNAYIDSGKIKQGKLLRGQHQKQKTQYLRQMRKIKEAQRTY